MVDTAPTSAATRVAVTGATGMVGKALCRLLRAHGHEVIALSRNPGPGAVHWDPARQTIDAAALASVDAVVHLAGENLAGGRWTEARKTVLRDSRVPVTRWLAGLLANATPRPRTFVSVSAVGIYGDRGDEVLGEDTTPGSDFLARLARDWEAAADPARQAGIRVVHPRFGVILSGNDGALAKMLPIFRLGLGGPIGNGDQWMSWITLDDVARAIEFLIGAEHVAGPLNVTAPEPVRNRDFATALGKALHRPAVIPAPVIALHLLYGEMADATVLASQRVSSARLQESGFHFDHPQLDRALAHVLGS